LVSAPDTARYNLLSRVALWTKKMKQDDDAAPTHGIKSEAITKPHQLAAAIVVAGIALGGCFIGAAKFIEQPPWASGALVLAAIVSGLGGMAAAFRLLTAHRDALQDDPHYAKGQTANRKALEVRVKEQKKQIAQQETLAEQRLSVTLEYFDVVSREMNLEESERARLRRALRETIRADEDRTLQHQAKNLLIEADEVFARARSEQPLLMATIGTRLQFARYEHLNSVYDTFVLAVELSRVASVLVPARSQISMENPPIFVQATLGILEVVLSELLMNARDYSPIDSLISMEVTRAPNAVLLVIKNALRPGDIVSEEWFAQGYRGATSFQSASSGAGLGLPLVRRMCSLLGGNAAMSQEGSFARMTVTFRD
jgi:signal transduction histidine kinase